RSDSSGLRRAPLFSRRSRVFSLILTIEPTFVARIPRNAPMRLTTEGGRPPRTTAAISRSFSSGYDLKTTDICLQNIDNCLEGQGRVARVSVVLESWELIALVPVCGCVPGRLLVSVRFSVPSRTA